MKRNQTFQKFILLNALLLFFFNIKSFSQSQLQPGDFNLCLKNISQGSSTTLQFDIYLEWLNPSKANRLTFFQGGLDFDYFALANGGVITGAFVVGSADPSLPLVQQTPNWNINQTSKQIRMLASIATPASSATVIPGPPGIRLGTFKMTNTVPFAAVQPNFAWSYILASNKTQTKEAFYLDGASIAVGYLDQPPYYNHCPINIICPCCNSVCNSPSAGGPYSSCGDVHLNGTITNAPSGTWTTSGSGTFDPDNTTLNATYHPSAADLSNGSVVLTLTSTNFGNCCNALSSDVQVTFISLDDNVPCTIDGCDQSTGTPTHTDDLLTVTATAGEIACYGGTTCITVTASGGVPPYNGTGEFCGYGAGQHSIDVTDSRGCLKESSITISEPEKITVSVIAQPAFCNDGSAEATVLGGTPPYSYLWTPSGATTNPATGLNYGNNCVVVTDVNGCTVTKCFGVPIYDPFPLGPVTGPSGVCKKQSGVVFCVNPVAFYFNYVWTLPPGATAVGPTNGPCITVKFSSKYKGGYVCAAAATQCGYVDYACKNVILITKKPNTPGIITASSTSLCPNEVASYSIEPALNATSFSWVLSSNLELLYQGTDYILVLASPNFNGGSIKVRANNCMGHSGYRNINISKSPACRISNDNISVDESAAKFQSLKLNVYPNPTSGKATVTFESDKDANGLFKIIDVIGKTVLSENISILNGYNTKEIDLKNLAKGIYVISLQNEDGNIQSIRLIYEGD